MDPVGAAAISNRGAAIIALIPTSAAKFPETPTELANSWISSGVRVSKYSNKYLATFADWLLAKSKSVYPIPAILIATLSLPLTFLLVPRTVDISSGETTLFSKSSPGIGVGVNSGGLGFSSAASLAACLWAANTKALLLRTWDWSLPIVAVSAILIYPCACLSWSSFAQSLIPVDSIILLDTASIKALWPSVPGL